MASRQPLHIHQDNEPITAWLRQLRCRLISISATIYSWRVQDTGSLDSGGRASSPPRIHSELSGVASSKTMPRPALQKNVGAQSLGSLIIRLIHYS